VLLALKFVVGVTNGRERDELPNLYGLSVYVLFSHPPSYRPYFPFYSLRGRAGYSRDNRVEKGKKRKKKDKEEKK
jgi:hypothetical protein